MLQSWGLMLLHDLLNLAAQRYGKESAHAYLRSLRFQAKIQGLRGLRAVAFVSEELRKLTLICVEVPSDA